MTGFDYADQRFYASTYGRFNTPDRKKGNGANPGSLNRYAYVAGDPINKNDPRGLCAVMIAGSAMAPGSNAGWTAEATLLQADTAYPNQGQTYLQSYASAAQQASGANASTATALAAIQYALSSNSGLVDIIAYSAGAAAFTAAYGELSAAQQARIGLVVYISPGTATQLANVQGTTSVIQGSGLYDNLATGLGTQIPQGVPIYDTSCSHKSLGCFFGSGFSQLAAIQSNGSCNSRQTFTLSQAVAAQQAAAAAVQQQQAASWWQNASNYMPGLASAFLDWVDSIPVGGDSEEVDEEIYFDLVF